MNSIFGVVAALVSLFSWGFGDFFIQRTSRVAGVFKALFLIAFTGFVLLFPFVYKEIIPLLTHPENLTLVGLLIVVMFFGALFDFEALKEGKMAIVEPIIGLELPLTVGLSVALGRENLDSIHLLLIAVIFIGIVLAITKHHTHLYYHKRIFEKGVILAGLGAIGMALSNFLVGESSQLISPLATIWFTHSAIALICAVYMIFTGGFKGMFGEIKRHPVVIVGQSILDNVAWLSFAYATTVISISITTAIAESYIALAVILGLIFNKEKLKIHQFLGAGLAIIGVIVLSVMTAGAI